MCKPYVYFCLTVILCACTNNQNIGEQYLGKPYTESPLGEEKFPDTDPLFREDGFDCQTFVETSLANKNIKKLNKIRYKNSNVDFLSRNHFVESDWLENNADIVFNASKQYAKTKLRTVVIDKQNWFKKIHNIKTSIPTKTVHLEYIPFANLNQIKNKKTMIVLFIVGKSKNIDILGTDLAVVHMGFLLPGGKVLRHASSTKGCVVDMNFEEYIAQRKQNKNNIGIVLLDIKNDK
ncbi:MAG: N-acetylmuramoyl-L-alanine amidase-like domain-containing protein [Alphaproteobacteria bacterium]